MPFQQADATPSPPLQGPPAALNPVASLPHLSWMLRFHSAFVPHMKYENQKKLVFDIVSHFLALQPLLVTDKKNQVFLVFMVITLFKKQQQQ